MEKNVHVEQVRQANEETLAAMKRLLAQLPIESPPSLNELNIMLKSNTTSLFLARQADNLIIGMAALAVFRVPGGLKAWVENVIVDETQRGKSIGEALILAAITHARNQGASYIHLTSKPVRVAANSLYQKLGFQLHETNFYKMRLNR